jgi:hypothetical protein
MASSTDRLPRDLAIQARRRFAPRPSFTDSGQWRRDTFRLPRDMARLKAREFFDRFPKAAYMTEVESWRVMEDDVIEFTMRRLPSAD